MDVAGVTVIPDSWIEKLFDLAVLALGGVMTRQHVKSENQAEAIRKLQSEHDVLKTNISNLAGDVTEVKSDVKETRQDIKILLQRRP